MIRPTGWGVCISPQEANTHGPWVAEQALKLLKPAWYANWDVDPVAPASDTAFVPMVWGPGSDAGRVAQRLAGCPGETWLLWNEPERPDQANMTPAEAAERSRDFLRSAWAAGHEFQWAAPGVSVNMEDRNGLLWLTEYTKDMRRHGVQRPTYWHVHGYRSRSLAEFRRSWRQFQDWYTAWGVGAPVVLSEVCAEGAGYSAQVAIMDEVDWLIKTKSIIGAGWFIATHSSRVVDWPEAALCAVDAETQTVSLTALGQKFLQLQGGA